MKRRWEFTNLIFCTNSSHEETQWYENEIFMEAIYNSLNADGMVVFELGKLPHTAHHQDLKDSTEWHTALLSTLQTSKYESVHVYSERKHGEKCKIVKTIFVLD